MTPVKDICYLLCSDVVGSIWDPYPSAAIGPLLCSRLTKQQNMNAFEINPQEI